MLLGARKKMETSASVRLRAGMGCQTLSATPTVAKMELRTGLV